MGAEEVAANIGHEKCLLHQIAMLFLKILFCHFSTSTLNHPLGCDLQVQAQKIGAFFSSIFLLGRSKLKTGSAEKFPEVHATGIDHFASSIFADQCVLFGVNKHSRLSREMRCDN